MSAIFGCLDAVDGDFTALLSLCLLYAIGDNTGLLSSVYHNMCKAINISVVVSSV